MKKLKPELVKEAFELMDKYPVLKNKIPHIFQNITGWFTAPRWYADMVAKILSGEKIAEIGVYSGCSFSFLAVEMLNAGKVFDLYAIDSFTFSDEVTGQNIMDQFIQNLDPLPIEVTIIKEQSWAAAELFEDNSVALAFTDADHIYESVKKDILAWWPKVKVGGYLAGHDYCDPRWYDNEHPGVAKAVHEIFGDNWCKDYLDEKIWLKYKEA